MMTYGEAQADTSDRFAEAAKLAKLRQYDLDLMMNMETPAFGKKAYAAGLASDQLIGCALEYLALEVQKKRGDQAHLLAPELQGHADKVGRILDDFVGAGPEKVGQRRAFLQVLAPLATADRNDEPDYSEVAEQLLDVLPSGKNRRQLRLRALGDREEAIGSKTPSPVAKRKITAREAETCVGRLRPLCEDLLRRVRQKDYFHEDHARDNIKRSRDQRALDAEIETTNANLAASVRGITDKFQQDVLTRIAAQSEDRQAAIEASMGHSSTSSSPIGTRPGSPAIRPLAGTKRVRETDDELPQPKRRAIDGHHGRSNVNASGDAENSAGLSSRGYKTPAVRKLESTVNDPGEPIAQQTPPRKAQLEPVAPARESPTQSSSRRSPVASRSPRDGGSDYGR